MPRQPADLPAAEAADAYLHPTACPRCTPARGMPLCSASGATVPPCLRTAVDRRTGRETLKLAGPLCCRRGAPACPHTGGGRFSGGCMTLALSPLSPRQVASDVRMLVSWMWRAARQPYGLARSGRGRGPRRPRASPSAWGRAGATVVQRIAQGCNWGVMDGITQHWYVGWFGLQGR